MAEHPQTPLGADPRVQQADAPAVPLRVLANGFSLARTLPLVERDQVGVGHVDLAAHFQHGGHVPAEQSQWDIAHGSDVVRDVVTDLAVPARHTTYQHALFVDQGHGHAVDLQFHDPLDRIHHATPWRSAGRIAAVPPSCRCYRSRAWGRGAARLSSSAIGASPMRCVGLSAVTSSGCAVSSVLSSCISVSYSRSLISGCAST